MLRSEPQPANMLREKHDVVSFFLVRHPSAGATRPSGPVVGCAACL